MLKQKTKWSLAVLAINHLSRGKILQSHVGRVTSLVSHIISHEQAICNYLSSPLSKIGIFFPSQNFNFKRRSFDAV